MDYVSELLRILEALWLQKVEYVLIGGAALNVHGLVRATEDVDLFVAPEAENIDRLKGALRILWEDPHIEEISADDLCGDYPAVRYGPPVGSIYLDILTRLGTAVRYEDLDFEEVTIGTTIVRVATPRALYRMKRDTVRPIDRADAMALRDAFDWGDDEEDREDDSGG
ncbi:MAG: nucleotidyl transferase AbiEii/AbiGii toxin family protein [Deltaproteobacteria bacterium]|nr:nucleotidyl transferase AbiEii/AbiGii toxin family protein [Deltaproteobacteria bacterium]